VPQILQSDPLAAVLLLIALALYYFVGRVAVSVVPARWDRAIVRAIIFAFPVLATSIGALIARRPALAAQLPIAASVLALTVGLGSLLLFRPSRRADPSVDRPNRSWALVLPAIGMVAIAGAVGEVDGVTAGALAMFGAIAIAGWRSDRVDADEIDDADVPYDANTSEADIAKLRAQRLGAPPLLAPLAALIVIAAACGLTALGGIERLGVGVSLRAIAPSLFALSIVMPMVIDAMEHGVRQRPRKSWRAGVSAVALFALVNLTFVLPAVAMTHEHVLPNLVQKYAAPEESAKQNFTRFDNEPGDSAAPTTGPTTAPTTGPATAPSTTQSAPAERTFRDEASLNVPDPNLQIPQSVWRADILALAASALLLVPLAAGLFRPGWLEALALLMLYMLYLLLSTWFAIQL
jgi:Ca2+/Na+ antiporter